MSALAGFWTRRAGFDAAQACARMLNAQAIYGKHAVGQWDSEGIAVGRRLHRTLPEDRYDDQPLVGPSGAVLVADVRLDNREELQAQLAIRDERAKTLCDAAVLLAAWERWGQDCFDRLVGDYAFAVWEPQNRRLVLARDPLGARPLHYHRADAFFAFASMPKGLHALPDVPKAPDEQKMLEFLALLPEEGPRSFFEGIDRVEPGHVVNVTAGGVERCRHWNPVRRSLGLSRPEEYEEGLRHHLDRAVRAQMRGAENAIGTQLSGGLDSSAVTATAARLQRDNGRVAAFTAAPRPGYEGEAPRWRIGDESPLAARTAALYPNIQHTIVRSEGKSPLSSADKDFFLCERPILNLCNNVWMHDTFDAARDQNISVMLVGNSGNFSISYDGWEWLSEAISTGQMSKWFHISRQIVDARTLRWRGVAFRTIAPWLPPRLYTFLSQISGSSAGGISEYTAIAPSSMPSIGEFLAEKNLLSAPGADSFGYRVRNILFADPGNYHKGTLGGWGLDIRDPTGSIDLVEYCLNVPPELYLQGGHPRAFVRNALRDRLPTEILGGRMRGYQAVDWHEGMTAAKEEISIALQRLGQRRSSLQILDLPRLSRLLLDWPSGDWNSPDKIAAYRCAMLRGISVGLFALKASGGNE